MASASDNSHIWGAPSENWTKSGAPQEKFAVVPI